MFQITKKSVLTFVASGMVMSSLWAHEVSSKADKIDFIENKGQWTAEAKYRADVPGGSMFLSDKGFVYNFASQKDMDAIHKMTCVDGVEVPEDYKINMHAYKVNFVGANPNVTYTSSDKRSYYHNYFIGNEQSNWASKVGLYGSVKQSNIYNGVDLVVYSNNNQSVKYDFVVAAGADASVIKLAFEGVTPKLSRTGDLDIKTSVNTIQEKAPITYQVIDGQKVNVKSKYVLTNGMLSFAFPEGYNKAYDLVVDPDLVFATYSGANGGTNYAHSTTYDNDGNTYASGIITVSTTTWPTTVGAYQVTALTTNSVGINKYNTNGSALIFSTFFGTSNSQNPTPSTLRVNELGQLFMAGTCVSATLPVTPGVFQTTRNGTTDLYVVRFSQDGATLIACTYVGGSGVEGSNIGSTNSYSGNGNQGNPINPTDIAFDNDGNVWVTGNSGSTDFPVTSNAAQATLGGSHDAVIFKMTPDLTTMLYSTYLGGADWDGGIGMEYNANNNTIGVVGYTKSANLPTTSGAYHATAPGGTIDGFVTLFNNANYNRVATSYIGSSGSDFASRLAFDCADNIYVAGRTEGNYPVTVTGTHVVPNGMVFIDKLNPTLSSSIASIRTGSTNDNSIVPTAMMVDICGNILVSTLIDNAAQTGMPLSDDAFVRTPRPFYFAAFEPNFTGLIFGSYFGALLNSDHFHPGVARIDPQGIIYQSVCYSGSGGNWPTTPTSFAPNKLNGATNDVVSFKFNFDAFAVKVEGETPEGGNVPNNHAIRGCKSAFLHYSRSIKDTIPMTIRLEILGDAINGQDYTFLADSIVIPANDSTVSLEIEALLAPRATGTRRVIINTFAPCACDGNTDNLMSSDTVLIIDSVYVNLPRKSGYNCPGDTITITAEIDPTLGYYWSPANLIPDANGLTIKPAPVATTNYGITVRQIGAPATCPTRTATYTAYVEPYPMISVPDYHPTICLADSFDLSMQVRPDNPGYRYQWSPGTYLRETNKANTKFYAPLGSYKLYMRAETPNARCASTDSMQITVVPPFQFTGITPKDTTIQYGESVAIEAFGDAIMWSWSPVDYLNDPMLKQVVSTPETNTKYTLIGWDKFGCKDTIDMTVRVKHVPNLFIPNAFTPNNDGLNDVFMISNIVHEKLISFSVYNKLGQEVFHTIDPMKGWDGTFKNGKEAPVDVYFYLIKISSPMSENGVYEYKGDVTLLR